jgi:hypothetical protein
MVVIRRELNTLKPFASVVIVIGLLLGTVFCKMEIRRVGYSVLKLAHAEKRLTEYLRLRKLKLAQLTRPGHVTHLAQQELTLKKPQAGQVIQLCATQDILSPQPD